MSECFPNIIGHEKICRILNLQINKGSISHAYLFTGPEGVGKTTIAETFLGTFHKTPLQTNLDHVTIKNESSLISVEQIRDMREHLNKTSLSGSYKTVQIEDADKFSDAAANALLKTLEEPRGKVIIILKANQIESVPATITSRCQILRFNPVSEQKIIESLIDRGLSKTDSAQFAKLSNGRPGYAIRFMKDGEFRSEYETAADTFKSLTNESLAGKFKATKDFPLEKTLNMWEQTLHQLFKTDPHRWEKPLNALIQSREAAKYNINPQIALEHIILSL